MSEFSKEYFNYKQLPYEGDFCYLDEFNKLKEGETFYSICEGLSVYGITRLNNEPFLIVDSNGKTFEYFSFINDLNTTFNTKKCK
jgi:hypothetical protein